MIDTAALRRNAEAATPGPWTAGGQSVTAPETEDRLPLDVRLFGGSKDDHRKNARYIAATNPAAILALLDALDALRAQQAAPDLMELIGEFGRCVRDEPTKAGTVLHEIHRRITAGVKAPLLPEELERRAQVLYRTSTANDPHIHCNRFPAWSELDEQAKQEWRDKVLRARVNAGVGASADQSPAPAVPDGASRG
jgi:hypothetical protein